MTRDTVPDIEAQTAENRDGIYYDGKNGVFVSVETTVDGIIVTHLNADSPSAASTMYETRLDFTDTNQELMGVSHHVVADPVPVAEDILEAGVSALVDDTVYVHQSSHRYVDILYAAEVIDVVNTNTKDSEH